MKLYLRPATMDDAEELFLWRNDPDTRRNSRTTAPAQWEGHIAWLQKTVSGGVPGRKLYVAQDAAGQPVGTVRSDEDPADGLTELSYTTAPSARGKGFGKAMVLQFVQENLQGKKLKATIKKGGNEASEKIARALGLTPDHEAPSDNPDDPRPVVEWR